MKTLTEEQLNDKIEDLRFLKMEHTAIYEALIQEAQNRIEGRL